MADGEMYLWNVSFYNLNSDTSKFMDSSSYRYVYVVAPSMEKAQAIAKKNVHDNEILDSLSRINSELYI